MRVEIGSSIRWKLRSSLRRSGRREIGGVIMGEQLSPGHFRIVDLTVDNETGGRFTHKPCMIFSNERAMNMTGSIIWENGTPIQDSR